MNDLPVVAVATLCMGIITAIPLGGKSCLLGWGMGHAAALRSTN
jgi:hypothetical protein